MKKFILIIFTIAVMVWFFVLIPDTKDLEMIFLDVGQGDAILVKTPKNQTLVIDGGPNSKVLEKLGKYLSPLQKRVDIVVLTHPHADHVTGLIEVLKRYDVGLLILGGANLKTDVYNEFIKTTLDKKVLVLIAERGQAIHFSEDLEFDILSPLSANQGIFNKKSEGFGTAGNEVNDASIVGKLIFNNFSVLLTGDATSKIENQLLSYGNALKSDILKVGHHGSKYSSSFNFLNAVSPKAAIIEVGAKNRYGHPSPAALSRLEMFDIGIFRTDLNGDVKVVSDGFTTNIYKEK
ncbi:MAG: MBL fold metallo-hydrolase [Parcubacteria group bacterium]|nr:MBL fold metallo-hydrolase [Parcubacteria group bacterium]